MLQKQLCREHKLCGPSFKLIYKTIIDIIFLYYYYIGANRDHSSIHMVNNLVGDSILIKTRACRVPISPNAPCLLRRKSFIRPHKAAASRRLAPALHSKAGHRICSRSHEECVLTWLACCDRPQDYSFLVTMGANGVLGLFNDIKALTSNAHFKVD